MLIVIVLSNLESSMKKRETSPPSLVWSLSQKHKINLLPFSACQQQVLRRREVESGPERPVRFRFFFDGGTVLSSKKTTLSLNLSPTTDEKSFLHSIIIVPSNQSIKARSQSIIHRRPWKSPNKNGDVSGGPRCSSSDANKLLSRYMSPTNVSKEGQCRRNGNVTFWWRFINTVASIARGNCYHYCNDIIITKTKKPGIFKDRNFTVNRIASVAEVSESSFWCLYMAVSVLYSCRSSIY